MMGPKWFQVRILTPYPRHSRRLTLITVPFQALGIEVKTAGRLDTIKNRYCYGLARHALFCGISPKAGDVSIRVKKIILNGSGNVTKLYTFFPVYFRFYSYLPAVYNSYPNYPQQQGWGAQHVQPSAPSYPGYGQQQYPPQVSQPMPPPTYAENVVTGQPPQNTN